MAADVQFDHMTTIVTGLPFFLFRQLHELFAVFIGGTRCAGVPWSFAFNASVLVTGNAVTFTPFDLFISNECLACGLSADIRSRTRNVVLQLLESPVEVGG